MNKSTLYCDLHSFQTSYRSVHGYLSLFVCVFGSIANILNICVLTTKEMRIPTNFILTGLAFSDLLVMMEYIPFTSHVYLNPQALLTPEYFSYPWAIYTYFHALFTQICHFNSCCLTVMLAVWRYIALNKPAMNKIWCNHYRTKLAIAVSCVLCPFVCTPLFLGLEIGEISKHVDVYGKLIDDNKVDNNTNNVTTVLYVLQLDNKYEKVSFLMYSVVLKLLPCVLLTVLSVLLIKSLLDAKKRWKNLSNSSGVPLVKTCDQQRRNIEKEQQADRTTRMLLAVLLLFLIPEFPQATLGLLSAILGSSFHTNCYNTLGDLWDITVLVNSSINFILYCSMSAQFRAAFNKMFKFDELSTFINRRVFRRRAENDEQHQVNSSPTRFTELNGGGGVHVGVVEAKTARANNGVLDKHQVNAKSHVPDVPGVQV